MKYRKKPVLLEATQWFKNGDHPQDHSEPIDTSGHSEKLTEGKVVKFFRSLTVPGGRFCQECGNVMQRHGSLNGINGEEIVHPGDYIVTDGKGRFYTLRPEEFERLYEPYEPTAHPTPKVPT